MWAPGGLVWPGFPAGCVSCGCDHALAAVQKVQKANATVARTLRSLITSPPNLNLYPLSGNRLLYWDCWFTGEAVTH